MNPITLAAPALTHTTPIGLVEAAASAGFDGLGMRVGRSSVAEHPFHAVVGNVPLIAEIKHRLSDSGLMLLELYSFYLTPVFDFNAFKAAMEVGADLGARYVVVLGYDHDWGRASDTFARMCEIARPFGLTLAVEFAPVAACWPATLAQALRLLGEAGQSNSALMPDPAHLLRSGGTVSDLQAVDPKYLRYSQICDVEIVQGEEFLPALGRSVPNVRRRIVGEGVLSVRDWMEVLPPGIPISVECLPQPQGMSDVEWATMLYVSTRCALREYHGSGQAQSGSAT